MRRRSVIIGGLAGLLLTPEHASTQQPSTKIPRVGILTQGDSERTPMLDALRAGLHDLGYEEGRNVILEFRFARGDPSRGRQLAAELVALAVDVIVSEGPVAPHAVDPSGHVPIVSATLVDPVIWCSAGSLSASRIRVGILPASP
jgi:putative ABC transport system substrate-binding protein